jgi:hypothetical protein
LGLALTQTLLPSLRVTPLQTGPVKLKRGHSRSSHAWPTSKGLEKGHNPFSPVNPGMQIQTPVELLVWLQKPCGGVKGSKMVKADPLQTIDELMNGPLKSQSRVPQPEQTWVF